MSQPVANGGDRMPEILMNTLLIRVVAAVVSVFTTAVLLDSVTWHAAHTDIVNVAARTSPALVVAIAALSTARR